MTERRTCQAEDQSGWPCGAWPVVFQLTAAEVVKNDGEQMYFCEDHRTNKFVWKASESEPIVRPHVIDGEFQSDKCPTTPRGKVPLSVKDTTAQDLLWSYAQRRREVDAEFAEDLEFVLLHAGYRPRPADEDWIEYTCRYCKSHPQRFRLEGLPVLRHGDSAGGTISMSRTHFAPSKSFSWPNPSQGPHMRTFHLGHGIVCPAWRFADADWTDKEPDVTCKRCLRIIAIGRYDTKETIREVLSRGGCDVPEVPI